VLDDEALIFPTCVPLSVGVVLPAILFSPLFFSSASICVHLRFVCAFIRVDSRAFAVSLLGRVPSGEIETAARHVSVVAAFLYRNADDFG
jgi:hypothetical protein